MEKQILTGAPPFGAGSLSVISRNATEWRPFDSAWDVARNPCAIKDIAD